MPVNTDRPTWADARLDMLTRALAEFQDGEELHIYSCRGMSPQCLVHKEPCKSCEFILFHQMGHT